MVCPTQVVKLISFFSLVGYIFFLVQCTKASTNRLARFRHMPCYVPWCNKRGEIDFCRGFLLFAPHLDMRLVQEPGAVRHDFVDFVQITQLLGDVVEALQPGLVPSLEQKFGGLDFD